MGKSDSSSDCYSSDEEMHHNSDFGCQLFESTPNDFDLLKNDSMKLYPFTIITKFFEKDKINTPEHSFQKSIQCNDIFSKDSDFESNNSDSQSNQQLNNSPNITDSEESMHSKSSTNDSQNDNSNQYQNQLNLDQNNSNMSSNDDSKLDQLENSISNSNLSSIDIQNQIENQQENQTTPQDKSEIVQEELANTQEKPTVSQEKPTVSQEKPTVSQEKPTISQEKPVNQQKRSKTKYTHKLKYYHRYIPLRGNRRCIEITMFPEINVIPPQNPSSIPPPCVNPENGNNSGN